MFVRSRLDKDDDVVGELRGGILLACSKGEDGTDSDARPRSPVRPSRWCYFGML